MFKRVRRSWTCALSACVAVAVMGSSASAIQIQPNEADSDDVFTYQFHGPDPGFNAGNFPDTINLDTDTLPVTSPIGSLLGTSRTDATIHNVDLATGEFSDLPPNGTGSPVLTGHDGFSWLRFDLSGVIINLDKVESINLNLWALDGQGITGAFENPSPGAPVETEVYAAGGSWDEQTLTWLTQGPFLPAGGPEDSVTQTGVNQWVSFDVTSLVRSWLDGSAANNGFVLQQNGVVDALNPSSLVGFTGAVSSLYASSAFDNAASKSLRPFLQINMVVPEPITATLSLMGLGVLGMATRRRMA